MHTHSGAAPRHGPSRERALKISLGLNGGFMFAEIVGGLIFGSIALLADAVHMLSDVGGLAIALVALSIAKRPPSAHHTYGLQRAEVLGALANAVTLVAAVIWIRVEGFRRLIEPEPIAARGVLLIAVLGLVVNVVSAMLLARARGKSLNMRGAFVHMVADAAGSVAVIVAAVAVLVAGATWVDPLASFVIAALILWATWALLKDTVHVLMEGTPRDVDLDAVRAFLSVRPEVQDVHHLHVWNLGSETAALSAHVVMSGDRDLHEAQAIGDRLKRELAEEFEIRHSTLELECHPCVEAGASSEEH